MNSFLRVMYVWNVLYMLFLLYTVVLDLIQFDFHTPGLMAFRVLTAGCLCGGVAFLTSQMIELSDEQTPSPNVGP